MLLAHRSSIKHAIPLLLVLCIYICYKHLPSWLCTLHKEVPLLPFMTLVTVSLQLAWGFDCTCRMTSMVDTTCIRIASRSSPYHLVIELLTYHTPCFWSWVLPTRINIAFPLFAYGNVLPLSLYLHTPPHPPALCGISCIFTSYVRDI